MTTYPPAPGFADVRVRTSDGEAEVENVGDADTCADSGVPPVNPCTVVVQPTTLETPPAQPNGGGYNSSLAAGTVVTTPVLPGESINVEFLLGVQTTGLFRFYVNIEASFDEAVPVLPSRGAKAARPRTGKPKLSKRPRTEK
ncbi:MAG TPA: hypothetical protein VD968_18505 [Pyrinomonadaceae bacterium]|nr:hypothetical protein [Pyrinomonadaceae bacterium]